MEKQRNHYLFFGIIIFALLGTIVALILTSKPISILSSCQPAWQITILEFDHVVNEINRGDVEYYIEKYEEGTVSIPLGQLLYASGYTLIDRIDFMKESGIIESFIWDEIAGITTINSGGEVQIDENLYSPEVINIKPSDKVSSIEFSILDIAPTIAKVLELPDLVDATGTSRSNQTADQAVMIMVDGLQYQKLISLIEAGKLQFFQSLEKIDPGLTVYPPVTVAATASLLTGSPPQINGVYSRNYRSTEVTTLFDLAVQKGKTVIAVEGYSISFNLRNAEIILSGDRDQDGFTDDNVFKNSLQVIQTGMPDLLFIHFHDIDDMGHSYGPDSQAYEKAIIQIDYYLSEVFDALPPNTFLIIFSDHGMHETQNGGNHGNLTAVDLIIPITIVVK